MSKTTFSFQTKLLFNFCFPLNVLDIFTIGESPIFKLDADKKGVVGIHGINIIAFDRNDDGVFTGKAVVYVRNILKNKPSIFNCNCEVRPNPVNKSRRLSSLFLLEVETELKQDDDYEITNVIATAIDADNDDVGINDIGIGVRGSSPNDICLKFGNLLITNIPLENIARQEENDDNNLILQRVPRKVITNLKFMNLLKQMGDYIDFQISNEYKRRGKYFVDIKFPKLLSVPLREDL